MAEGAEGEPLDPSLRLPVRHFPGEAPHAASAGEVLPYGEGLVGGEAFQRQADVLRAASDPAACRAQQPGRGGQQGRLAGTVAAEQHHDRAGRKVEVDLAQHPRSAPVAQPYPVHTHTPSLPSWGVRCCPLGYCLGMAAGVLFDVDGTLVDTPYLHTVTWWEAFGQGGFDVPMARIHRAIGMGSDKILDHLLGQDRDKGHDDLMRDAHASLYATYWERLRPLPGAADLLRACAKRGLAVVLASSAEERELAALCRALDADDVITAATSSADAPSSKPDPDILVAALEQSGLAPDRVVMVGDSVWDVAAARRLDVPCIGLTCGGIPEAELREAGAVQVYDTPAHLLDVLDESAIAAL